MDSFTLYRERIGESLARRLADAIGQEIVSLEEAAEISNTILTRIDTLKNHHDLISFIEELAQKWPLFGPLLVTEQAQKIEESEETAVNQISDLLKENRLDEAIDTASQATQASTSQPDEAPVQEKTQQAPQEAPVEETLPTQETPPIQEETQQVPQEAPIEGALLAQDQPEQPTQENPIQEIPPTQDQPEQSAQDTPVPEQPQPPQENQESNQMGGSS